MNKPKKRLAIGFIVLGIVGFIYAQNSKSNHRILSQRYRTHKPISESIEVKSGNCYTVSVWMTDEEQGLQQWAKIDAEIQLLNSRDEVLEQRNILNSEAREEGGIKRVTNGHEITYCADDQERLFINVVMKQGDYLDIEVYENLPGEQKWLPPIFIALFLVGLVLYLRARAS